MMFGQEKLEGLEVFSRVVASLKRKCRSQTWVVPPPPERIRPGLLAIAMFLQATRQADFVCEVPLAPAFRHTDILCIQGELPFAG